jgi:hypothetical protein
MSNFPPELNLSLTEMKQLIAEADSMAQCGAATPLIYQKWPDGQLQVLQ